MTNLLNLLQNEIYNYSINDYQPNYRYFYLSKQNYYTYKELMKMLDSTQYMVILTDKK